MTTQSQATAKRVIGIRGSLDAHWVGDGFPVRTLFSYHDSGQELSPFLLLDYAGPRRFPPSEARLGVGQHPHRGFETVTIVYEGEVEHRDSSGAGGRIGPGDVQWMTAAAGVVHEEFHGRDFARRGGLFEMVQLWVNLPARDKMAPPRYQALASADIPVVSLGEGRGELRVIAGEFAGARGPARTFTPIHVWDVRLEREARLEVPAGFTTALVVLHGSVRVNGSGPAEAATYALLDREGTEIRLESQQGARLLLLSGAPIDEPISGYGPFVMNTPQEIRQAIADFQSGKMGQLAED
jgi:redox-sensitive bicupin YhaK (pirin superfamily)